MKVNKHLERKYMRNLVLRQSSGDMQEAGQIANLYAQSNVWQIYHQEITENTRKRQMNDLASYCAYLDAMNIKRTAEELFYNPVAWAGTTYGLLAGYVEWSLQQGYSIGTINVRLATLRKYCMLAGPSPEGVGVLDRETFQLIQTVKGIAGKKARNRDREVTRVSNKKATPTEITIAQALSIKKVTVPHARGTQSRDAALMGLLVEHALRCGEVADLNIEHINSKAGTMTFYREKTDQIETHTLKKHTLMALETYLAEEQRTSGPLFMGNKGNRLARRAINARVKQLGHLVGVEQLSPHDLRHFWTFDALRNGTPIDQVKSGGGWKSDSMVLRYAKRAGMANAGVKITEEDA
jgi:integrase